jgi:hypothetical protein
VKASRSLILVLLLAALLTPILGASTTISPYPQPVGDCTYLLTILEKTIDYALVSDQRGEYIARVMLNTPVDTRLQELHRKAYRTILDYYQVLSETDPRELDKLRSLLGGVDEVGEYAKRLRACSPGTGPVAVVTRIEKALDTLKSRLEDLIVLYSEGIGQISVNVTEKVFNPSEEVQVLVYFNNTACSVREAVLLYRDIVIETTNFTCSDSGECKAILRVPPASSVQGLIERRITGPAKFTIAVKATCSGRDLVVYRFIGAQYDIPRLTIDAPPVVTRGDLLNITITVDNAMGLELTGVLLVRNTMGEHSLLNITVNSTLSAYQVLVDKPYFTAGNNVLRLCVNASERTLPYCFEKAIIVQLKYPSVSVKTALTTTTLTGGIPVYIDSGSGEYIALIYLNGALVSEYRVSGAKTTSINSGLFPFSVFNLTVIIRDPSGVYDDYVYSAVITSINVSTLILAIFAGSLLTVILREHEKVFMLALRASSVRTTRGAMRGVPEALKSIFKPYAHIVKSHILELYYQLLGRLGARLPHHYETLREHYYDVVKPTIKKSLLRELLWRMLNLAEMDLYSQRRPRLEEAEDLHEGVLGAIEEES